MMIAHEKLTAEQVHNAYEKLLFRGYCHRKKILTTANKRASTGYQGQIYCVEISYVFSNAAGTHSCALAVMAKACALTVLKV